jgi:hypothetical protein
MHLAEALGSTRTLACRSQGDSGEEALPMNRNRHRIGMLIAMGVVALGSGLLVSVAAADPPVRREGTVVPSRKLDLGEAASVAGFGTRALVCIAEARGAIQERDASRARAELRKAENLLNSIGSTLPTAVVKDRIWVARRHLEYEETQQVLPDLVPIEQELILLGGVVPTGKARSHLQKARELLESGDKQAGRDELEAVDTAVVYEEVDLPISEAEVYVSRALSGLAIGETEKADSALQAAENSVRNIVAVAREPLTKRASTADTRTNEHTGGEIDGR